MMGPILGRQPYLNWRSGVNAVFVGNSLVAGVSATNASTALPGVLSTLAPVSAAAPVINLGVNGRAIAGMTSDAATVDARYVPGKVNILYVLEGTNSVYGGETAQQCYADMKAFCSRVLVNPWLIVLVSTLPFTTDLTNQAMTDDYNARVDGFNALMKANYRSMGAKFYLDLRVTGSVFHMPDYTPASFNAAPLASYWDGTGSYRVHFCDAGYAYIASLIAAASRHLPRR